MLAADKPCMTGMSLLPVLLPVVLCIILFAVPASGHDGDINLDSAVDVADLLWGLQSLQGSRNLLPEAECRADVAPLDSGVPAPDGLFNPGDVIVLLRMLLEDLYFGTPGNQFNIGDSIGEGEAADNTIGEAHHETVWSTAMTGRAESTASTNASRITLRTSTMRTTPAAMRHSTMQSEDQ